MLTLVDIRAALVEVLNSSTRPPALSALTRIHYPQREVQPQLNQDGSYTVKLYLRGYGYKASRRTKPALPPPVSTESIRIALNALLPADLVVTNVWDGGTHIILILEVLKQC